MVYPVCFGMLLLLDEMNAYSDSSIFIIDNKYALLMPTLWEEDMSPLVFSKRGSALAAVMLLSLGGCASPIKSTNTIRIESTPAGAAVYASGAELGETPLSIVPGEVFPSRFVTSAQEGIVYRYTGTLTLKKPGCETYSTQVNDAVLSKDIQVKLTCDPNYQPPQPAAVEAAPVRSPAVQSPAGDPLAARLQRLEALHQQGLITDEEYQTQRRRILNEL